MIHKARRHWNNSHVNLKSLASMQKIVHRKIVASLLTIFIITDFRWGDNASSNDKLTARWRHLSIDTGETNYGLLIKIKLMKSILFFNTKRSELYLPLRAFNLHFGNVLFALSNGKRIYKPEVISGWLFMHCWHREGLREQFVLPP